MTELLVRPEREGDGLPEVAAAAPRPRRERAALLLHFLGRRPGLLAAAAVVLLVLTAAVAPHVLASGDPDLGVVADKLRPPNAAHPFGTDYLGRDVYTRVVFGASLSLKATVLAVTVALVLGGIIGLLAGFVGRWVDEALMRVVDVLMSIPPVLLSLALITALGYGTVKVAIAVGIASVANLARVMRAETLRIRRSTYVEAARAVGTRWYVTLWRHVLPNAAGPVLVLAVLEFGLAVLAISSLSFLGFGAPPPAPEWGSLIAEGRNYLATSWWLCAAPGLTIAATVLSVNRISRVLDGEWGRGPVSDLLEIDDLHVSYRVAGGRVDAVRGISLSVGEGEVVAVVGESGSGKSTLAQAVIGLLAGNGRIDAGSIRLSGDELVGLSEKGFRSIRGRRVGLVPQDPTIALNPVTRIGAQVAEALRVHGLADRRTAQRAAVGLLEKAGLPPERAGQYPHELSGGMRQRVLIAIATAADPRLIIADEPTSALDATVQRRILDHLDALRAASGTAMLLITHDLGVAADRADRIVVMSGGRIVESGPVRQVMTAPAAAYTRALLAAAPGLSTTAAPHRAPGGPPAGPPLVEVRHLVKEFRLPRVAGRRSVLRAVDDVSFTIARGETLALVGESGSGKSTVARLVLRLTDPTAGQVAFDGVDITRIRGRAWRELRRRAQLVYQNPYASLDPRFTVEEVVTEPLRAFGVGTPDERRRRAAHLVERVALPSALLARRPAELSGGQRQRVAVARALALSPDLVVCDEPVSALDVSVQAQVLALLEELQGADGLAYLFISHDLAVVRRLAHRVGVMREGRLLELRPTEELFIEPREDYTRELLAAIAGQRRPGLGTVGPPVDPGAAPVKESV